MLGLSVFRVISGCDMDYLTTKSNKSYLCFVLTENDEPDVGVIETYSNDLALSIENRHLSGRIHTTVYLYFIYLYIIFIDGSFP